VEQRRQLRRRLLLHRRERVRVDFQSNLDLAMTEPLGDDMDRLTGLIPVTLRYPCGKEIKDVAHRKVHEASR
jgi:hypothetical protein